MYKYISSQKWKKSSVEPTVSIEGDIWVDTTNDIWEIKQYIEGAYVDTGRRYNSITNTHTGGTATDASASIIITGVNPQMLKLGEGYTELGATATDGSTVNIDISAFTDQEGSYPIIYSGNDAEGNAMIPVTRTVVVTKEAVNSFPTITERLAFELNLTTEDSGLWIYQEDTNEILIWNGTQSVDPFITKLNKPSNEIAGYIPVVDPTGDDIIYKAASEVISTNGLTHTSITNIDLKPTGNTNEYTVEIEWTDENGTVNTTTDATPITISAGIEDLNLAINETIAFDLNSRISTDGTDTIWQLDNGDIKITRSGADRVLISRASGDIFVYVGGVPQKVWHAGNDGAGSGLDAEFIEGTGINNLVSSTNNMVKTSGTITMNDNTLFRIGTSQNTRLRCDGTDTFIDLYDGDLIISRSGSERFRFSRLSGAFTMTGNLQAGSYSSGDGSAGLTTTVNAKDENDITRTLTFKNGLLTNITVV